MKMKLREIELELNEQINLPEEQLAPVVERTWDQECARAEYFVKRRLIPGSIVVGLLLGVVMLRVTWGYLGLPQALQDIARSKEERIEPMHDDAIGFSDNLSTNGAGHYEAEDPSLVLQNGDFEMSYNLLDQRWEILHTGENPMDNTPVVVEPPASESPNPNTGEPADTPWVDHPDALSNSEGYRYYLEQLEQQSADWRLLVGDELDNVDY